MFDCPSCGANTPRLIIYTEPIRKLGCPNCGTPKARQSIAGLGQTVSTYIKSDGSKGRITTGKKWEIEHRRTTPEGIVINSKTGKETQY